jgi:hypothetical protein
MKKIVRISICVLVCAVCAQAVFASSYSSYPENHSFDSYEPYFALEHGKATINEQKAPFVGLSFGIQVFPRVRIGAFGTFQLLSSLPGVPLELAITDTESSFVLFSGAEILINLFEDAGLNPFVKATFGGASTGYFLENNKPSGYDSIWVQQNFSSSVATGIEWNLSRNVSICFTKGIRFTPHADVLGMERDALSGSYSSITFKSNR